MQVQDKPLSLPSPITREQLAEQMPSAKGLLSDEPEMESSLHAAQMLLLVSILEWLWLGREDYFIGYNLTIYFNREQLKTKDFRGPDFFLVKNVLSWPRPSWVVWEEGGRYPDLIIELLSDSTAESDRTTKKAIYQDIFRTPEYFWFSPESLEFVGLRLQGSHYQEIPANEQGWRWSEELGLYLGIHDRKLRYFGPEGELIPTPAEAALQERQKFIQAQQQAAQAEQEAAQAQQQAAQAQQQAEQAQQQMELERQKAERLANHLRSLGVDPENLLL